MDTKLRSELNGSLPMRHFFASRTWVHLSAIIFVLPSFIVIALISLKQPEISEIYGLLPTEYQSWGLKSGSLALCISALTCLLIVSTARFHERYTMDADTSAIQKLHRTPVPRIGGLSIFLGVLSGWIFYEKGTQWFWVGIFASTLPVFLAGMVEDITKKVSPKQRLAWAFVSGLIAAVILEASITSVGITSVDDHVLSVPLIAIVFSAFAVAGLANAINMIDGLNGLAAGAVNLTSLAIALIAWLVGDHLVLSICLTLSMACLGFWVFNYPFGKVFLGDGGAYFSGALLGIVGILLQARNPETVDAWLVLSLLAYPVIETLFSILRRKINRKPADQPDNNHLHQLVQRSLASAVLTRAGVIPHCNLNSNSTPFLWLFCFTSLLLCLVGFFTGLPWLGFALTATGYGTIYYLLRDI